METIASSIASTITSKTATVVPCLVFSNKRAVQAFSHKLMVMDSTTNKVLRMKNASLVNLIHYVCIIHKNCSSYRVIKKVSTDRQCDHYRVPAFRCRALISVSYPFRVRNLKCLLTNFLLVKLLGQYQAITPVCLFVQYTFISAYLHIDVYQINAR